MEQAISQTATENIPGRDQGHRFKPSDLWKREAEPSIAQMRENANKLAVFDPGKRQQKRQQPRTT